MVLVLFTAHRMLQSADHVLNFARSLVGLTFGFQLLVAEDLSGSFFHGPLGLLCRTKWFRKGFRLCRGASGYRDCLLATGSGLYAAIPGGLRAVPA